MRIAMFSDCYVPVINGVVTSISCLKQALEAEGHSVTVYAPRVPGQKPDEPEVRRFTSFMWPFQKEERFSIPWPPKTMQAIMRDPAQIIHVHTPFNVGLIGWWKARRSRVPMVFTHHTLWEEYIHYLPVKPETGHWLATGVCGYFFRRSARLVAPSEEVKARMREQGVLKAIDVIPTGIDTEIFRGGEAARARQELGLAEGDVPYLYIGRIGKEKSIEFVLESFRDVLEQEPRARLTVIGDGPHRPQLEAHARGLGLDSRVRFLGYRPRQDLRHYLAASRAFLFASQTETQGLVLLEAMAAGVPVVGIRASGTNEAVKDGHCGFLHDPGQRAEFAGSVLRLARDEELHRGMSERARDWAEGFSAHEMARKMTAAYQAAMDESRKPAR